MQASDPQILRTTGSAECQGLAATPQRAKPMIPLWKLVIRVCGDGYGVTSSPAAFRQVTITSLMILMTEPYYGIDFTYIHP